MAEWLIAPVLKTGGPQGLGGSNPSPSAKLRRIVSDLICVPWGHHIQILSKCSSREKALFYVRRTIQNGWSRNSLLNWLSTDLYEREGKGQTNFALTMPSNDCDLAQQLVKCYADAEAQFAAATTGKEKKGKATK